MKVCNVCEKEKELHQFYSQEKINSKGENYIYYRPECKQCTFERSMQWREENRESYLESCKRRNNKPKAKERIRKANKKRRESGEYREWQQNNKDKIITYSTNRSDKNHNISKQEWEDCKGFFDHSCAYCGMTYDEHKELYNEDLHKEHVDCDGSDNLDNCVPSCRSCNSSKHTYSLTKWYVAQDFYNPERYEKILDWLNDKYQLYIKQEDKLMKINPKDFEEAIRTMEENDIKK